MGTIEWNNNLSVNVEEIDAQHKKLLRTVNKLYKSITVGAKGDIVGETLNGLTDYVTTHFKTEEDYFDKFNYSKASSHKKEHKEFIQKVSEFKKVYEEGRVRLNLEIAYFLSDWLINHLLITDKEYSACFNDNGLK
jgi:hemerythrin